MKCPHCGFKAPRGAKFCQECGASLQEETPKQAPKAPPVPTPIDLEIEEPDKEHESEALLEHIRKGKEFLGERFDKDHYRHMDATQLRREYFKLFHRVMTVSAERLKKFEENEARDANFK